MRMIIRRATIDDAAAITRIHMDSWRSTYRGLVSDDFLDNLRLEDRVPRWQKRLADVDGGMFTYVAEAAPGLLAGFSQGGLEGTGNPDYTGELWSLHIAEPYQGAGLGRRLTSQVANHLYSAGHMSMLLWVLTGNHGARRFYERLGGVYIGDRVEDFAGGMIDEVAYGWPDITLLL
jgi:ribosomal protein S18 acetylase RimI-like enzyme